jgi:5'-nucleotidase
MLTRLLLGGAVLALSVSAAAADDTPAGYTLPGYTLPGYTLHVLHINDFHSRIEPINRFDSTCPAAEDAEGKCFGGVARLATAINSLRDRLRAEGQNVIVLDAGDQFQGSLFFTTYRGAAEAEFMETIGFDAMVLGNHEFNNGPEGLAPLLERVTFPVLAGNIDIAPANPIAGRVQRHAVLEVGGERIGIVSALTTDTVEISNPGPDITFRPEVETLARDVAELTAEGVTKIIALTHVGLRKDLQIAATVPGIDAVVGGHSHSFLSATDPERDGAYPTFATGPDGALVPVVQAYAFGRYLGHLVLEFDAAGNLLHAQGDTMLLDASVAPDPAIAARVQELGGPIAEVKARVVGEAATEIAGVRELCRAQECPMGNLVAEAMLDRARPLGAQIAIQNGGGLRASIDAGPVTMGEVLTVLPFQNTLAVFTASGATILAALENGVSQVEEGAGRFPQVAGLKYTFDPALPAGSRVSNVMVATEAGFVPLDPAKDYGVVTNSFLRGGGDGYRMFADIEDAYDFGPDLADVTAEFLAARSPYTPFTDGRITRK